MRHLYKANSFSFTHVSVFVLGLISPQLLAQNPVTFPSEFTINGEFDDEGDHEELSAIAVIRGANGLLAPDEGKRVYPFKVDYRNGQITLGEGIKLTDAKGDIDIEGIAAGEEDYFIVGSHGISRRSQIYRPNGFTIWKLRVDPDTGSPSNDSDIRRGTLADLIALDPTLSPHYRHSLQENGINIEGLAYDSAVGHLYAGFRAPTKGKYAFVLEVDVDTVFGGELRTDHELHRLELGEGYGIRDLIKVDKGFLVLAGNAAPDDAATFDPSREFQLFFWKGSGSEVTKVASVRKPTNNAKPEALLLLRETTVLFDLLVLSDSAPNGSPTVLHVAVGH